MKCITDNNELNNKLNKIGPDIMEETTILDLFKNQIKKKIIQIKILE